MTLQLLNEICEKNSIPKDVELLSDSGWECSETEMNGVWYNKEENTIIFTQEGDKYDRYYYKSEWKLLYGDEMRNKESKDFHCKAEESRWQDASACNDCQNKCEEYHQWDKEIKK